MREGKSTLYDQALKICPGFERQEKTVPNTSANGHMFSLLNPAGELGIRFSKGVQKRSIEEWPSTIFRSYGATMQGSSQLALYLNEG